MTALILTAALLGSGDFAGPFPSWADVKRDYGAIGDGRADDTAALQRALDGITTRKRGCVLWLPAGTYRITSTLRTKRKEHTDCLGAAILGEDPATTSLLWDGPEGGTILEYDAWYSRIGRLTLDGRGRAAIALRWGPSFSTYNETADVTFLDADDGLVMGGGGNGQAENLVIRCRFERCRGAGVRTIDFNSMDVWVWESRFEDCGVGLRNDAGNFHAARCVFLRSTSADVSSGNLMVFSFLDNVSSGSACFLDFANGHTWGSPTSLTGNRILDVTGPLAIKLGNGGPYYVADNVIRARAGATGPLLEMTPAGDQLFVGNTYSLPDAVAEAGRFRRIDERVVDLEAIDGAIPPPPTAPRRHDGPVFEVAAGADAAAIQAAIDGAAARSGEGPVVHLPMGTYAIDRTLVVPAGLDVRLVGDGGAETATVLRWSGPAGGLMLRLDGPSRARVEDLDLESGDASALRVADADQPGAVVFADQLNTAGLGGERKAAAALRVEGLREAAVLCRSLQGGSGVARWVDVIGTGGDEGDRDAAPAGTGPRAGQVTVIHGATGTADAQYHVARGGRLVVRGVYHEIERAAPEAIRLDDAGTLAIDATRFSYQTAPDRPLIRAENFRGRFTLLTGLLLPVNSPHPPRVVIGGDGAAARLLVAADQFWLNEAGATADTIWSNAAAPPARAAFLLNNANSNTPGATPPGGFLRFDDRGEAPDAFVRAMVAPLRATPAALPPAPAPAEATDVRLHRVIVRAGRDATGVALVAGSEAGGVAVGRRPGAPDRMDPFGHPGNIGGPAPGSPFPARAEGG